MKSFGIFIKVNCSTTLAYLPYHHLTKIAIFVGLDYRLSAAFQKYGTLSIYNVYISTYCKTHNVSEVGPSEVWYIDNLKHNLKSTILAASAKALRVCLRNYDQFTSYETLHRMAKRATSERMMIYKLALQLYPTYNYSLSATDWNLLQENIIFYYLSNYIGNCLQYNMLGAITGMS